MTKPTTVPNSALNMAVFGTLSPPADFFDFNLMYLRYVGLWPDEAWPWTWSTVYRLYENALLLFGFLYLTLTGIGMYMNKEDVIAFLENMDKAIVAYNYMLKVIMFFIKRKQIRILVSEILHSGDRISEKRKKLMKFHAIAITGMIMTIISGFQILAQIKGEMVVDAWLPFDPLKNTFTVFLAGQIMGGLFLVPGVFRAIAIQGIVCSIIMYICDQLIELQKRLKALTYSGDDESSMREEFKDIIKKHIRLMGYSRSLKSVFKEYFLIQNLAITAELCLNALMVSIIAMEQKKHLVTFMAFLMVALFNAYIFCYLGQELMDQSGGIAFAAYEATWTSWPVDMQRRLLIVITAAQKNFSLSAGGLANMSMETFALALYNGYSIFAVLRDVVD